MSKKQTVEQFINKLMEADPINTSFILDAICDAVDKFTTNTNHSEYSSVAEDIQKKLQEWKKGA